MCADGEGESLGSGKRTDSQNMAMVHPGSRVRRFVGAARWQSEIPPRRGSELGCSCGHGVEKVLTNLPEAEQVGAKAPPDWKPRAHRGSRRVIAAQGKIQDDHVRERVCPRGFGPIVEDVHDQIADGSGGTLRGAEGPNNDHLAPPGRRIKTHGHRGTGYAHDTEEQLRVVVGFGR